MRVIEAQFSWSWRLTITLHINHDSILMMRQKDLTCSLGLIIV
jgi:hypothetical protein